MTCAGSIPTTSSGSPPIRRGACRCAADRPRSICSKPFVPEEYTQLYYTPVYRSLHRAAPAALQPALRRAHQRIHHDARGRPGGAPAVAAAPPPRRRARNPALVRCIDTMIEEEKHHYRCFAALNRACFPDALRRRERYFSDLPLADARAVRDGRTAGGPARLRALVPDGDGGILDRARPRSDPQPRRPRRWARSSRPSRRFTAST